jgi:tetratricopeptide (TPR) repeat protein
MTGIPDRLGAHCRAGTLVLFAGAGVSMQPPTCLPSWKAINEIVLDALAEHTAEFTDQGFADELRDSLVATRNATSWFTPDYQAQLIEDEIGHDYFRVLQALDTDACNSCHEAIAALAARGSLAAIVTTNFDRLLERALDDAGVQNRVYFGSDDFDELPRALAEPDGPFPVIKPHGSVESPDSMVDTLRQRLIGRPEGLEQGLVDLMTHNHVLFLGFSGADLAYDPNYLGLRRAATGNQGFTCLVRPGDNAGTMRALAEDWGSSAQLVEGALPGWVLSVLASVGIVLETAPGVAAVDRSPTIAAHAAAWSSSLGHMVTVAVMAALLESSGREELAFDLLRRTLRSTSPRRSMDETGYASFNYQLGHRLLERGTFNYDVDTQQGRKVARFNESEALTYSPFTANDCFQCLNRSTTLLAGQVDMGLYQTYWGMPQDGAESIRSARRQSIEQRSAATSIDACTALGVVYEILMQYADALDWLEQAHRLSKSWGDEPRRARVCAELARFYSATGRHDEAHERVLEGLVIADRLSLDDVRLRLFSAQGSVLVEQRRTAEALAVLTATADRLRALDRRPALTRTLIDVCYGHFQAKDWAAMEAATDELIDLTDVYVGYRPLVCLMRARFATWLGLPDDARFWIEHTKAAADGYQNPGVHEEVTLLADRLATK